MLAATTLLTGCNVLRIVHVLPDCPEDAVLIGHGQFENGRWDTYGCGPARDDYVEGENG